MRAACFAPSFLQKREEVEGGLLQAGSSHFRASTNVRFRTILRYEGRFYKGTDSYKSYKLVQTCYFSMFLMPYWFYLLVNINSFWFRNYLYLCSWLFWGHVFSVLFKEGQIDLKGQIGVFQRPTSI